MDNNEKISHSKPANEGTAIKVIIAVAIVVAVIGAIVATTKACNKDTAENTEPVKTEIATDANGTPTVIQGTAPDGTRIEDSTYPDGTQVEFATTSQGEYATEPDGSYIINYMETTLVPVENSNNSNNTNNTNTQNNNNTNNTNNTQSNSNDKTNESATQSTKPNSSTDKKPNATKPNATKPNSTTDKNPDATKPNGSTDKKPEATNPNGSQNNTPQKPQTPTNNNNNNNNSSTVTPPNNGDANVDINAGAYNVGDKIKVSYYLKSNINFCGIQCSVNYDSSALKVDEDSVDVSNLAGPMYNTALENKIKFLSSAPTAVNDFKTEKLLFSCEFEVLKTTNGDVTINIEEILDNDVLSIPNEQYTVTAKVEKL